MTNVDSNGTAAFILKVDRVLGEDELKEVLHRFTEQVSLAPTGFLFNHDRTEILAYYADPVPPAI